MSGNPIAGWYADPAPGSTKLRYWDGTKWTDQYRDQVEQVASAASTESAVVSTAPAAQAQAVVTPVAQPIATQTSTPVQPIGGASVGAQQSFSASSGQPAKPYAYGQQPGAQSQVNALAIASLACGAVGIISVWFIGWLGLVCAIVAVVLGAIGMRKPNGKGMAIAGLVLGIVTVAIFIIAIIIAAMFLASVTSSFSSWY